MTDVSLIKTMIVDQLTKTRKQPYTKQPNPSWSIQLLGKTRLIWLTIKSSCMPSRRVPHQGYIQVSSLSLLLSSNSDFTLDDHGWWYKHSNVMMTFSCNDSTWIKNKYVILEPKMSCIFAFIYTMHLTQWWITRDQICFICHTYCRSPSSTLTGASWLSGRFHLTGLGVGKP
jgi:hypothetical protein